MNKRMKDLSRQLRYPMNRRYAERRLKEYHAEPRSLEEAVRWAMTFGGGGYLTIKTLQIPQEITALARAVEAIRPQIIVEIGTARGGTLLIWAKLAAEEVLTCDLNDMTPQQPVFSRLPPPDSECAITLLSGNSHNSTFKERLAAALNGRQADFLFIDGDHTESGVEADFNDYQEFVRPGGLIAFHDIVEHQPLESNQVYRFWRRIKQRYQTEEFIADPHQCGFGIGLLHKP